MEHTIKKVLLGLATFALVGCGSGSSSKPPNLSESVLTKTVVMEPFWPELLQANVVRYQLQAVLKGEDAQGKAAGEVGPVAAESVGGNYQFIFSDFPSGLNPAADLTIEVFWNDQGVSEDCRRVASISKAADLSGENAAFSVAAEEFDLAQDCDGDGWENIREFLTGTRPDLADTDGDGVGDAQDVFPLDPLENADADGDNIGDNQDNCREATNANQDDLDGDGLGDFCDPDRDGDGLSNDQELGLSLNPDSADTDGDAAGDGLDNCSTVANASQANADGDPYGDVCDCDAADGRRYQTMEDEPDTENFDSNCDEVDGDRTRAVFLSQIRGNDAADGSPAAPYRTLAKAYAEAIRRGLDVYAETGTYTVDDSDWSEGIRIFGGYQTVDPEAPFDFRCVYPDVCAERTALDSAGTFLLEAGGGAFLFNGFRIAVPLVLRQTEATFQNSRMEEGILIDNADDVTLDNNIIRAGTGRIAVGLEILGSSPTVSDNTIDATNRYDTGGSTTARTTIALVADNALGLDFRGNLLITSAAENQYVLFCRGLEPAPGGVTGNLFSAFPLAGGSDTTLPRSVSCLGEFDFAAADGLDLGVQNALGNSDYPSGRTLGGLIDLDTYEVIDPEYVNFGARL